MTGEGGRPVEWPLHSVRLDHRGLRRLQGGDDWRRVHGCQRSAAAQRRPSRRRDSVAVTASPARHPRLPHPPSTQRDAPTTHRTAHRYICCPITSHVCPLFWGRIHGMRRGGVTSLFSSFLLYDHLIFFLSLFCLFLTFLNSETSPYMCIVLQPLAMACFVTPTSEHRSPLNVPVHSLYTVSRMM